MHEKQFWQAQQAVILLEEGTVVAAHAFNTVDESLRGTSSTLEGTEPLASVALLLLGAIQSCPPDEPEIRVKLLSIWALVAGLIREGQAAENSDLPF